MFLLNEISCKKEKFYFHFIFLIQISFPLVSHTFDLKKLSDVGYNIYRQIEEEQVDPAEIAKQTLSVTQAVNFIVVVLVPIVLVLLLLLFSCICCCCICCNGSKKYYKKRLNIEKQMVQIAKEHEFQIDSKQLVISQVVDNEEFVEDQRMNELISQYQALEESRYKYKALKGMGTQKGCYICYFITLILSLVCYCMLVTINILGSNGTYTNNVVTKAVQSSQQTVDNIQPFTNGIDKLVGTYVMGDSNYNKISKLLNAEVEEQDVISIINDILKKLHNLETVDNVLDQVNKFYYDGSDSNLVTVLRNAIYYQKCNEDYIKDNSNSKTECADDQQTDAYKQGIKFLKLLYDANENIKNIMSNVNDIANNKVELPEKIQEQINSTEIKNVNVKDLSQQSFGNVSLNTFIKNYDEDYSKIDAVKIVNELIDQLLDKQNLKKILISTTAAEDVPTLSTLLDRNVTSTKALLDDFIGEGSESTIPTFDQGFDYRECYEDSYGKFYMEGDNKVYVLQCEEGWYRGKLTENIEKYIKKAYKWYSKYIKYEEFNLNEFYEELKKYQMSKEEYEEYKIYYDKRRTCNEWQDIIDSRDPEQAEAYYIKRCHNSYYYDDYYYSGSYNHKVVCTSSDDFVNDLNEYCQGFTNNQFYGQSEYEQFKNDVKALLYEVNSYVPEEYVSKAMDYAPLIIGILSILILVLPTFCCIMCEATKHKCCYGCIDCWMPVQAVLFFFIYLTFFFMGMINSGFIQPVTKMATTDLDSTLDQASEILFSNDYYVEQIQNSIPENFYDYKFRADIPTEDYYKVLKDGIEVNTLEFDFSGYTLTSFLDSFKYQVDLQQQKLEIEEFDGPDLSEYPYNLLPKLFTPFKDYQTLVNTAIQQLTKDAILDVSLAGTKVTPFGDSTASILDNIMIGGKRVSEYLTQKIIEDIVLKNTLEDANIVKALLKPNTETNFTEEVKQVMNEEFDITDANFTSLKDDIDINPCSISDDIFEGRKQLKKLFYPDSITDDNIIDIPTKIYNAVQSLTDDVTNNKNEINGINMTMPSTIDSDYVITKLETALYNLIIMNSIQQQESFINGKTTSTMGVADKTFSEIINNMYSTDSNGKVVSNFDTLVNSETIRNATNEFIPTVKFATSEEDVSTFGCTKDLSGMSDSELTAYIPLYQTAIEGNSELKTKVQRIARAFYDRSGEGDTITVKDAFTMYGYCKAVIEMNSSLLAKQFLVKEETFTANVKAISGLNEKAINLDAMLDTTNATMISLYNQLIGEPCTCSTSGNDFIISKNEDSFINKGFKMAQDILGGCLKGIQQVFYSNDTIKPSIITLLGKEDGLLDTTQQFIDDLLQSFINITLGDNSIANQKLMTETLQAPSVVLDEAFKPAEYVAVIFYALLIITLLLPWLLCCSKKYSYQRFYQRKLAKSIKKIQKKSKKSKKEEQVEVQQQEQQVVQIAPAIEQQYPPQQAMQPIQEYPQQPQQFDNDNQYNQHLNVQLSDIYGQPIVPDVQQQDHVQIPQEAVQSQIPQDVQQDQQ